MWGGLPLRHDRRGNTAVEFALVLPLLLMILVASLEFGRAMWIRQSLQFAVEEAARYALVEDDATASAISARVMARLAAAGPSGLPVQVTAATDSSAVSVVATVDFATVVPGVLPSGFASLTAKARLPR